jgi:predicted RNA methylase
LVATLADGGVGGGVGGGRDSLVDVEDDARRLGAVDESTGVTRAIATYLSALRRGDTAASVRASVTAVEALTNRSGDDVVLACTHDAGKLDENAWDAFAESLLRMGESRSESESESESDGDSGNAGVTSASRTYVSGVVLIRKKTAPKVMGRGDFVTETMRVIAPSKTPREVYFKHRVGSFANPNPDVAELTANYLCDVARELTNDGATPTRFVELYAGCGNHTVVLAPYFTLGAYAVEIDGANVEAARENFAQNNVDECHIVQMPAEDWTMPTTRDDEGRYESVVVLVDPPRGGLDARTLDYVSRTFHVVIYVACDYMSLRRDLDAQFLPRGFKAQRLACFDHAPTSSKWIETVAVLVR